VQLVSKGKPKYDLGLQDLVSALRRHLRLLSGFYGYKKKGSLPGSLLDKERHFKADQIFGTWM